MSYERNDLPSRPPTPYPFPSDPTWGRFGEHRGPRFHPPARTLTRPWQRNVHERSHLSHRYVAPRLQRRASPIWRGRDRSPIAVYRKTTEADNCSSYSGKRRDSAADEHASVQERIEKHNAEIARRPPHYTWRNYTSDARGQAGNRRVHFRLPVPKARDEIHLRDLEKEFSGLSMSIGRCRLCGRQLDFKR